MNATTNVPSTTTKLEPYKIDDTHAGKLWSWLQTRGGVFVWKNADMGDWACGKTVCTPALTETGEPMASPHWKYTNKPDRHITDPADVVVAVIDTLEIVPLVMAPRGWVNLVPNKYKLKLEKKLEKTKTNNPGADCWYELDGESAIFRRETAVLPLRDYMSYSHANHAR